MKKNTFVGKRSMLVCILFCCLMFLIGGTTVSAAAVLKELDNDKPYSIYDFTGDGKADQFLIDMPARKIRLNGKSWSIPAALAKYGSPNFYYYKINAKNIFLMVDYDASASFTKHAATGYRWNGSKFVTACEPAGSTDDVEISGKLDGSNLLVNSSLKSTASGASCFMYSDVSSIGLIEKYYVNTTKNKVCRKSNYASLTTKHVFYYASKKTLKTSTSPKTINTKGQELKFGQKVQLTRIYLSYTGEDARKGTRVYELLFNGKKSWLKESSGLKFVSYNPKSAAVPDVYTGVINKKQSNKYMEPIYQFANRIGAAATKDTDGVITCKGSGYSLIKYNDLRYTDQDEYRTFRFVNTGSKKVCCAGVKIGMTVNEAQKAFQEAPQSGAVTKSVKNGKTYLSAYYLSDEFGVIGESGFCYDTFTLALKNGKISSYSFRQTFTPDYNDAD